MPRLPKFLLTLAAAVGIAGTVNAFSLLAPATDWQTDRLGYHFLSPFEAESLWGPVQLGEEYRMNVPTVYYGFTPDFLNFFGQRGAQEIDKAFDVLNKLPPASKLNIDDYPLSTLRMNHRANELSLRDLKSTALSMMLHQLGLGDPVAYVWTLRSRWTTSDPDTTNFFVINRNYDPATWRATPFINGQLWTYTFVGDVTDDASAVIRAPVDPLALAGFVNRPVAGVGSIPPLGSFWTGLTRDDVGAIRYIYRKDNYNVENYPENITGTLGGGPWGPPPGVTNVIDAEIVNDALRPGRDRIRFLRANYNSMLGLFEPFTNNFTDTYITNSYAYTQNLERPLVTPDILFHVADLTGGDAADGVTAVVFAHAEWVNNDELNGIAGNYGPGVIPHGDEAPSLTVTLGSTTHFLWNTFPFTPMDELGASQVGFFWGSFDGSTNEPVVYPVGIEVRELERLVLRGDRGHAWSSPPWDFEAGDGGLGVGDGGGLQPIQPGAGM